MFWNLELFWDRWSNPFAGLFRQHRQAGAVAHPAAPPASWQRDPLSHPALQAMSQRALGDLPFDPRGVAEE